MKISKADWDGFADDVVDLVIRHNGEVTLNIDDVRLAAHSRARNIYQQWWWDANNNRAHPQFGGFFHHFLEVVPHTEGGRIASITFRPKRKGFGGKVLKAYWRLRHLLKSKRGRERRGWEEFSDYLLEGDLREDARRVVEVPIESVRMGTHTRDNRIYSQQWWRPDSLRRDKRTRVLVERRLVAEAIAEPGAQGGVARVQFRLDGEAR